MDNNNNDITPTRIFIVLLITVLIVFSVVGLFAITFHFILKNKITSLSKLAQFHRGQQLQLVNQVFGAIKDTIILCKSRYYIRINVVQHS